MRSIFKIISAGLLAIIGCSLLSFHNHPAPVSESIRKTLVLQADSFSTAVQQLQSALLNAHNKQTLQRRFRETRLAYKRMEWATEYFDPLTSRSVNGPPVPETEPSGQVILPQGLQVIEELLFPRVAPSSQNELADLLNKLLVNAREYQSYFERATLHDWQIMDATKLEIFRIEALGLNDFDDPLSQRCFAESAAAMGSVYEATIRYKPDNKYLYELSAKAISYLNHPVGPDRFDRAKFLTDYCNPLTRELTRLQKQLNLANIRYNRLLNQDAATLFDSDAFNRNAYTAAPEDSVTAEKITLGKKLFFDTRLSGTMTRSCASCHQPAKAFTDGLVKNLDITGKKTILRNTPTLINAALQPAQFYDLRAPSLEDQVNNVVNNRDEMHGDMKISTKKFWQDKVYQKLFAEAFPSKNRVSIDTAEIMNALASYIRSLTLLNSRFDIYMRGDQSALNQSEVKGFNLFMGKARCSTCHYLPLFNSTIPPRYMQMEAEVIGVPKTAKSKYIDPDPGLFAIQPQKFNRHAFKVTTVRNAAKTAPYMHNGVYNSLDEVMDFYNKGGGAGMGLKVPNQTLSPAPLKLTAKEKHELIDFIKSLNSQ
ncbi:hypothetical protein MTO98_24125 [Mucilaginibacter sp. SMC90]|uniref:cytochrome c peroxidase n=1 Tax=Mucilaginibacter sp. SMC90 TaxID=2929803 RepID=UPI001FB24234|nr:cytochrome c peroxidase [Mucilaginibacter sp. SMC90]UOE47500.1 hypothetical protein MTO98_24125 [Mucilaginibacter sp. SMC90]